MVALLVSNSKVRMPEIDGETRVRIAYEAIFWFQPQFQPQALALKLAGKLPDKQSHCRR